MKKIRILIVVCIVLLLAFITSAVFAQQGNFTASDTLSENSVLSKLNANSVSVAADTERTALLDGSVKLESGLNTDEVAYNTNGTYEYYDDPETYTVDYDNMYKVFILSTDDVKQLPPDTPFSEIISENYIWEAPILNSSNEVVSSSAFRKGISESEFASRVASAGTAGINFADERAEMEVTDFVRKNAGKWYWIRTGNMIPLEELEFVANRESVSEFIAELGLDDIVDIKYVALGKYRTEAFYIRVESGDEYAIPFTSHPEIENRALYPISELISLLPDVGGLIE
jgi:hypothetical protein